MNDTVDELNTLITGIDPPKQVDAPPDVDPGDEEEVVPEEVITYAEVPDTRLTQTVRVFNPDDATLFVDVEQPIQFSFDATDQPRLVLQFIPPEEE